MISRKHLFVNLALLIVPWLSMLFIGKRTFKQYSFSGIVIVIFEILNHLYGNKRKWWKFYDKPNSFLRDELPFDIGPYMPLSMWMLKLSYGNFKKFILLNAIANGLFAFVFFDILEKLKIVRLHKLNRSQFFIYLHYKAYVLYGVQYLYEKVNTRHSLTLQR